MTLLDRIKSPDGGFTTDEDSTLGITLADLLENDFDPDAGDTIRVTEVSGISPVGDAERVSFYP